MRIENRGSYEEHVSGNRACLIAAKKQCRTGMQSRVPVRLFYEKVCLKQARLLSRFGGGIRTDHHIAGAHHDEIHHDLGGRQFAVFYDQISFEFCPLRFQLEFPASTFPLFF